MIKTIAAAVLLACTTAVFADNFAASLNQSGAAVLRQAARERAMGPLGAEGQTGFERLAALFEKTQDEIKPEDALGVTVGRAVSADNPDLPLASMFIGLAVDGGPALGLRVKPFLPDTAAPAKAYDSLPAEKLKEFMTTAERNSGTFTVTQTTAKEIVFVRYKNHHYERRHALRKSGDYLVLKESNAEGTQVYGYAYFFKKIKID